MAEIAEALREIFQGLILAASGFVIGVIIMFVAFKDDQKK